MTKVKQTRTESDPFLRTEGGRVIVQRGHLIEFITVFKKDGTLVFKRNKVEDLTIIENLKQDNYLIVVNWKRGGCFISNLEVKKAESCFNVFAAIL